MLHRPFKLLCHSWPLVVLTLPFGALYCSLLCFFPDAIEASVQMQAYTSEWGGVEVLFMLNSAGLGWASVVVSERRIGGAGPAMLLFAWPCCLVAIASGFAAAPLFLGGLTAAMKEMLIISLVSVLAVSGIRVYWGNIR